MSAKNPRAEEHRATASTDLLPEERLFHRDRLLEARYAALDDAEGFQQMCFAIETLGKRLLPEGNGLGSRRKVLHRLALASKLLPEQDEPGRSLKTFDALFVALKDARNDAMHTGAYARHVAADAVTLCLVLEDALMVEKKAPDEVKRLTVGDFMVSTPVVVHTWQTVEHARHLMLLNSFSYLPMWQDNKWWLLSDMAVAKYLRPHWPAQARLKQTLADARTDKLNFLEARVVTRGDSAVTILEAPEPTGLWLVEEQGYPPGHLVGVLSPFELM